MVPKKKRQVSWVPSAAARHLLAHASGAAAAKPRTARALTAADDTAAATAAA